MRSVGRRSGAGPALEALVSIDAKVGDRVEVRKPGHSIGATLTDIPFTSDAR
jgi:hypothetical protein